MIDTRSYHPPIMLRDIRRLPVSVMLNVKASVPLTPRESILITHELRRRTQMMRQLANQ